MSYDKYIEEAVESFRNLLTGQLERQERMEKAAPKKDFAALDKVVVGVIGGDGIGPAITAEAVKILNVLLADEIASGKIELREIQGLTIENREKTGQAVPDDVMVTGFDGSSQSALVDPALTTVQIPSLEIGRMAADMLLTRMRYPELPYGWLHIRTNPVWRKSTR